MTRPFGTGKSPSKIKKVKIPLYSRQVSKSLRLPELQDNRHMKVVRLPYAPAAFYLWYSFLLETESTLGP